jgi:hypothetical protein
MTEAVAATMMLADLDEVLQGLLERELDAAGLESVTITRDGGSRLTAEARLASLPWWTPPRLTYRPSGTLGDRIYTTPVGANPASICITLAGTSKRVDIGTNTSPSSPLLR